MATLTERIEDLERRVEVLEGRAHREVPRPEPGEVFEGFMAGEQVQLGWRGAAATSGAVPLSETTADAQGKATFKNLRLPSVPGAIVFVAIGGSSKREVVRAVEA